MAVNDYERFARGDEARFVVATADTSDVMAQLKESGQFNTLVRAIEAAGLVKENHCDRYPNEREYILGQVNWMIVIYNLERTGQELAITNPRLSSHIPRPSRAYGSKITCIHRVSTTRRIKIPEITKINIRPADTR
jgi:hypothetical protein